MPFHNLMKQRRNHRSDSLTVHSNIRESRDLLEKPNFQNAKCDYRNIAGWLGIFLSIGRMRRRNTLPLLYQLTSALCISDSSSLPIQRWQAGAPLERNRVRNLARALAKRDITVPTGQFNVVAISS